jgi:hypothetical protein
MIFASDTPISAVSDDPGIILEVVWHEPQVIAALTLDRASFEAGVVALPFSVPPGDRADQTPKLEVRLYTRGECSLLVTSIDLRRMTSAFRHFAARGAS